MLLADLEAPLTPARPTASSSLGPLCRIHSKSPMSLPDGPIGFQVASIGARNEILTPPTVRTASRIRTAPTERTRTPPRSEKLDYSIPPPIPLYRPLKRLLEMTELPFMLLWVYSAYWITIMCLSAHGVPSNIWYAAMIAGLLVGLALNANAYKYTVKPRSRSRSEALKLLEEKQPLSESTIDSAEGQSSGESCKPSDTSAFLARLILRFPRLFKSRITSVLGDSRGRVGSMEPSSTTSWMTSGIQSMNAFFPGGIQWSLDYGTMVRFFIIPFGVSSLAGVTSHHRDKFLFVFPRQQTDLYVALLVPFVWCCCLFLLRMLVLWKLNVSRRWKVVFFNGCLVH